MMTKVSGVCSVLRFALVLSLLLSGGFPTRWGQCPSCVAASARDEQSGATSAALSASVSQALAAKDYAGAHRLLVERYRRGPRPELLYYLGIVAAAEGRDVAAYDLFVRFLAENVDEKAELQAEARRLTAHPSRLGSKLTILGPAGGLVFLDDRLVGALPFSRPVRVAPGPHRLDLEYKQKTIGDQLRIMESRDAEVRFDVASELVVVSQAPGVALSLDLSAAPTFDAQLLVAGLRAGASLGEWAALLANDPKQSGAPLCIAGSSCQKTIADSLEVEHVLSVTATSPSALSLTLVDAILTVPTQNRQLVCGGCDSETVAGLLASLVSEMISKTRQLGRGTLSIVSMPPGAVLRVDGKEWGRTPVQRMVHGGEHTLELSLFGHQRSQRAVAVPRGETVELSVAMTPGEDAGTGPGVRRRMLRTAGGISVGAAALLLGIGTGLLAIDGSCAPLGDSACSGVHVSRSAGGTLLGSGLTSAVAGSVMLILGR